MTGSFTVAANQVTFNPDSSFATQQHFEVMVPNTVLAVDGTQVYATEYRHFTTASPMVTLEAEPNDNINTAMAITSKVFMTEAHR